MIGPNLNAIRYFKNNFSRAVPVDRKSYELFYSYLDLSAFELIKKLKALGIHDGTVYTFGYTHFKYYYNLEGFRVIGDYVNQFRYRDLKDSMMEGRLYSFLKNSGANSIVINKKIMDDFDFSRGQLLAATQSDPRLSLVYEDSFSLVVKVVK